VIHGPKPTGKPCPGSGRSWTVDKSGNPICPRCRRGLKTVAGIGRSLNNAPKVPSHDQPGPARSAPAGAPELPRALVCPECGKRIRLNDDGTLRDHDRPLPGGPRHCPGSAGDGVPPPRRKTGRRRES